MKSSNLSIATISWARNPLEEQLLKRSLTALAKLEKPVFVTDAGSGASFVQYLHNTENLTAIGPTKGVWPQAKQSIAAAAAFGADWILYTEPDKLELFQHHLSGLLEKTWSSEAGVILLSRSSKAFRSFPAFQQTTESTINKCCQEMMKLEADYVYGPFIFKSALVEHLSKVPDDIGWGWRPYLFAVATMLGYKIEVLEGDFLCPADQQLDDEQERIYRMKQMVQNINGLILAANYRPNNQS